MEKKKRRSRRDWVKLIAKMNESGMSQSAWCKKHGINYRSMQSMKSTLKTPNKQAAFEKETEVSKKTPEGFIRIAAKDLKFSKSR